MRFDYVLKNQTPLKGSDHKLGGPMWSLKRERDYVITFKPQLRFWNSNDNFCDLKYTPNMPLRNDVKWVLYSLLQTSKNELMIADNWCFTRSFARAAILRMKRSCAFPRLQWKSTYTERFCALLWIASVEWTTNVQNELLNSQKHYNDQLCPSFVYSCSTSQ